VFENRVFENKVFENRVLRKIFRLADDTNNKNVEKNT
jgi:hypothetical protein